MPRAHHRSSAAAERPARGTQAGNAARYIGALALLAVDIAHIEQYVDSYRAIPTIGTLFALTSPPRPSSRWDSRFPYSALPDGGAAGSSPCWH
jgi:hypothetical protein